MTSIYLILLFPILYTIIKDSPSVCGKGFSLNVDC